MPNWCSNRLVIAGLTETEKETIAEALAKEELLETFIPTPDGDEAYGHHCEEWGTKWDVGGDVYIDGQGSLQCFFDSAWSPPVSGLTTISRIFPGAEFRLEYNEPGMTYCGVAFCANGECNDASVDYDDIEGVSELDYDDDDAVERLEELVEEWISNQ